VPGNLKHYATPDFWVLYDNLPNNIKELADRNFEFLKNNPTHPSLHLKKVGEFWSVRVGMRYRALAVESERNLVWFWIGTHADYDKLIKREA
jgi:hypothetical protein